MTEQQSAALAAIRADLESLLTESGLNVQIALHAARPELMVQFDNGRMGSDGVGGQELQQCCLIVLADADGYTICPVEPIVVSQVIDDSWAGLDRAGVVAVVQEWAVKLAQHKDLVLAWLDEIVFERQCDQYVD